MAIFQPSFVVADDDTLVSLKFVAEMRLRQPESEEVCERLRADASLFVTMSYGKVYTISMKKQIDTFSNSYKISTDVDELKISIYEKWLNFIR